MNKLARILSASFCLLTVTSCSQVLQNVVLDVPNNDLTPQENFQVEEKTLTLTTAKIANQDPYPRNVIQSGRGSSARPIREVDALLSNFPAPDLPSNYKIGAGDVISYAIFEEDRRNIIDYNGKIPTPNAKKEYTIGIGDEVQYTILRENIANKEFKASFPPPASQTNYVIGIGDELSLLRVNEAESSSFNNFSAKRDDIVLSLPDAPQRSGVIATTGRVGSDGSILLLEVGRIEAAGKTLTDIQAEVRNILIRDGLSPRFQLEISSFSSQKATLTVNLPVDNLDKSGAVNSRLITLTDRTATLRDLLAAGGLGVKTDDRLLVTLKRDDQIYKMTMRDIFNVSSSTIIIEDGDTISVDTLTPSNETGFSIVMADGTIVIPKVGRITARGVTLDELKSIISKQIPKLPEVEISLDLNVVKFASKQVILTSNISMSDTLEGESKQETKFIVLTDRVSTIKTALAQAGYGVKSNVNRLVTLNRGSLQYKMNMRDIFNWSAQDDIALEDGDSIFVDELRSKIASGTATVMSDGTLVIPQFGRINAMNQTLVQIREDFSKKIQNTPEVAQTIDLDVVEFASQSATIHLSSNFAIENTDYSALIVPISTIDLPLSNALIKAGVKVDNAAITQIKLQRGTKTYSFTFEELLTKNSPNLFVMPDDQIFVERLKYKSNKVFAVGGVEPKIINISPENRETLADALFTENGVLSSETAQRSDVYLLRGTSPIRAYRLDAQSPTRLIVADAMELRPNDILYVSEQPIISFNRALERIIPLRTLIDEIANASN